jgi:hypothetical protein
VPTGNNQRGACPMHSLSDVINLIVICFFVVLWLDIIDGS